jgi:hypothetical protein
VFARVVKLRRTFESLENKVFPVSDNLHQSS